MAASTSLDHLSNRMKLEWYSKLNTEMVPSKNYRRTSIIGTIGRSYRPLPGPETSVVDTPFLAGPKTNSVEKINSLRKGTRFPNNSLRRPAY